MRIVNKLEDTLGGGFKGLHGEVVTEDCYRLKSIDFVPDVIFDIGGNVGTFTRHARSLFPDADIIAVEPHEENIVHFHKFTDMENVILYEAALGRGKVNHMKGAVNGAHEVYISEAVGYSEKEIEDSPLTSTCNVQSMTLADIVTPHIEPGMRAVLKIDCEGGENCLWDDERAMEIMKRFDYIAIELHYHSFASGHGSDSVRAITDAALDSFDATHDCERGRIYFTARRRNI